MAFYVYENWTHKKAIVHLGRCRHCNHGQGIHVRDSGRNGRWLGPYESEDQCLQVAKSLNRRDTRTCNICLGGQA